MDEKLQNGVNNTSAGEKVVVEDQPKPGQMPRSAYTSASTQQNPQPQQSPKKNSVLPIVIGGVAAVCVIGIVGVAMLLGKSNNSSNLQSSEVESSAVSQEEEKKFRMEGWNPEYPEVPDGVTQKYYVIYKEGFRGDEIEMAVFDMDPNVSNYIVWDGEGTYLELFKNDLLENCVQYYLSDDSWEEIGKYIRMSDKCNGVICSNVDVRDLNGAVIVKKSK